MHGNQKRILFVGPLGTCGISTVHRGVLSIAAATPGLETSNIDSASYRIPRKVIGYICLYLRVVATVVRFRPQVVYLQISQTGYFHQSICLLVAKLLGRRTIAHFHAQPHISQTARKSTFRSILLSRHFINQLVVLSATSRDDLMKHGWRGSIDIVPNFLQIDDYPAVAVPWEKREHIVFVGRMTKAKGIFDIVEIAKLLPKESFVLFGPFESMTVQAEFQHAAKSVQNLAWKGPIFGAEKLKWISNCKLTLLPSATEVFPMSVLESCLCHTVPVVTEVGMIPSLLADGANAIFVQHGAPAAAAAKMKRWLADPNALVEMAAAARRVAEAAYTEAAVRTRIQSLLR